MGLYANFVFFDFFILFYEIMLNKKKQDRISSPPFFKQILQQLLFLLNLKIKIKKIIWA
jgi:hypothetical protein